MLDDETVREYFVKMQRKDLSSHQRTSLFKQVHDMCKKTHVCPHCKAPNGVVKKMPKMPRKIVHVKSRYA